LIFMVIDSCDSDSVVESIGKQETRHTALFNSAA
jgi:hypothetical protein